MEENVMTDERARELKAEYITSMTTEDEALMDIILENECYFSDMCLEADSVLKDFVEYEVEADNGETVTTSYDHYIDLYYQNWRFYVEDLQDDRIAGETYIKERKIVINQPNKNELPTILHEMIHAHETIINNMFPFYHDIIMICLYNALSPKIPDLYERIVMHTNEVFGEEITLTGGSHDVLFYLKSLDLDLRLGYKLGTVCGYGRDK